MTSGSENKNSESLKPADKFELNRMIHARAQELHLGPNSPAGKSGHHNLSWAARGCFGVSSFSQLNAEQIRKLYDFLDEHKRLPIRAELK